MKWSVITIRCFNGKLSNMARYANPIVAKPIVAKVNLIRPMLVA
jgi:hypothetical protein